MAVRWPLILGPCFPRDFLGLVFTSQAGVLAGLCSPLTTHAAQPVCCLPAHDPWEEEGKSEVVDPRC